MTEVGEEEDAADEEDDEDDEDDVDDYENKCMAEARKHYPYAYTAMAGLEHSWP